MSDSRSSAAVPFAVVVDDDPVQLQVLAGLLRKAGLEPLLFASADAALEALVSRAGATGGTGELPELIVTGLNMPGIDGWRFCRLLRSPGYRALNRVPVLVCPATFAGDEAARIAAEPGASGFIPSPVDSAHFLAQVQAIRQGRTVREPLHLLIVADGPEPGGQLRDTFAARGCQADVVYSVEDAIRAFRETAYGLVVLDYRLPDGPGDVLLDRFHAERPDCVFLMMTADPRPELPLDWLKRGAAACLRKPFDPEYLVELCQRASRERALLRVQDLLEIRTRELRESERNLAAMINASLESAFLIDGRGKVLTCNTVGARRLGKEPEELNGRILYDFLPPPVAASRRQHVEQAIESGQPLQFEDFRAGRSFSNCLYPVVDGQGRADRVAIFSQDITNYKETEDHLNKQKELLTSIRQVQSLFISGHEPRLVFQDMLHILVEATGSEYGFLDEVLYEADGTPYKVSLALSDISWDEDSRRLYGQLAARQLEFRNLDNLAGAPVLEGRTIITNEPWRHPRYRGIPAGHPPLNSYLGIPLYFGTEIIGVAAVANRPDGYTGEIAEFIEPLTRACAVMIWASRIIRRDRENLRALKASEERYRQIAETANEGIWAMDAARRTTYVNPRMAGLLGYQLEEMIGRQVDGFMFPEDLADHSDKMAKRRLGQGGSYERRFRHRDGREVWTIVSATAQLGGKGDFAGSFAMLTDITERKQAEEARRESEARYKNFITHSSEGIYRIEMVPPVPVDLPNAELVDSINQRAIVAEVNDALAMMYGLRREDMIGRYATDFAPNYGKRAALVLDNQELQVSQEETMDIGKHGNPLWLIESYHGELEDGRLVRIWGVQRNNTERKQAENALRESESRAKAMLQAIPDLMFRLDRQGVILDYKADIADLYVRPEESLAGKRNRDVTPPEFADLIDRQIRATLETGVLQTFEYQLPIPGRGLRDYEARMAASGTDEVTVIVRDVTERKQAEEALRKSEARFRKFFEESPAGIWEEDLSAVKSRFDELTRAGVKDFRVYFDEHPEEVVALSGQVRVLVINRTSVSIIGAESKEQVACELSRYFTASSLDVFKKELIALASGQTFFQSEIELLDVNGRPMVLDLALSVQTGYEETLGRVLVSFVDRTARKRAEEALCESETRLRTLSDNLPGGLVYQIDSGPDGLDRRFTYVSAGIEQLHGISVAEALADAGAVYGQVAEEDRQKIAGLETAAIKTLTPLYAEVRIRMPSGETRWRSFSSAPRRLPNGHLVWDGIEIDITGRKQAEEEKTRLEAQLQQAQKMESVGRLAGGVAHDFNNMLGVILGHAELALDRVDPAQPARADLEEICKAANRSADLTRQLLAFARKQTVAPQVLDLNETIAGTLKMLKRLIGENIQLAWRPAEDLWPVRIDPSQIDQILTNLCVNARDAITGTGLISISTDTTAFDAGYCASHPGRNPGDYVQLAVGDNGCGMDASTRVHLFEPFFTTKAAGAGTGLGLSSVYGAVRQNNGFVDVWSEPGQGTVITIYLPKHAGEGRQPDQPSPVEPARLAHETVLLVEDEPFMLKMATMMLERLGYTVLPASVPGEAIRLAGEHPGEIHLLMTDVVMPEMNGRDLAKSLLSSYPRLRCLFMSGYPAAVIAHQGVLEQGVKFIHKPFSSKELALKLKETLDSG